MKKLILSLLISFCIQSAVAQTVGDSIIVSIDTINIHGKVVDEIGKPVVDAIVLSETFDKSNNYIQTKTNNEGLFKLNGINSKDIIRVRKQEVAVEQPLKGSRYLFIVMLPLHKFELNASQTPFHITAKKNSIKEKYVFKKVDKLPYVGWHIFGHYWRATYPGGTQMYYDFIQKNIVYPEKAIKNSIEGTVKIEFTVDHTGVIKDITILRDIGYGCAEEVIRVIKTSKKWNPAMNGLPVDQRLSIEVPFKLID